MSLFNFFDGIQENTEETNELPIYTEVAWDFERNTPIIENGEFKIVKENEAIKTWCYKTLQVNRYKYLIYSWNYGSEFESLIGQHYTEALAKSECIRYVEECLMVNPYITGLSNIVSDFKDGLLTISCDLNTVYGNTNLKEVSISV